MKSNLLILFAMAVADFSPVALTRVQAASMRPEAPSACALLSRSEVGDAAGITVAQGELRLKDAAVTRCLFSGGNGGNAAILVRRIPSSDWEFDQRARLQRGVQFGVYNAIEGIGDRAFWSRIGQGSVLCVFVREYYVQISLFRMGEASRASAILEKLARRALTRLPTDRYARTGAAGR